ncbi:MAG: Rab family GTPase [Candidatus Thorarchaeota archaeon]
MTPAASDGRQFKTVLIGDSGVGKTSIRREYMGESFISSHLSTLGVDFARKDLVYKMVKTRLIIWDLAGQHDFESVRKHYYLGSHSIILVYSVIDRQSFDNASKWLVEAYKYMGKLPPTLVLGNKTDIRVSCPAEQLVNYDEGKKFTEYYSERLEVPAIFYETSALTGENIQVAFTELIGLLIETYPKWWM